VVFAITDRLQGSDDLMILYGLGGDLVKHFSMIFVSPVGNSISICHSIAEDICLYKYCFAFPRFTMIEEPQSLGR
jgi:hypothetical protein